MPAAEAALSGELDLKALEERWTRVRDGKAEAERCAGLKPGAVRLVAVSKFHPAAAIAALYRLGQRDFGENYMQEARAKQAELAGLDVRWHAIGPIQTNKAKDAAGHFALIHTLSSLELARALARRLPQGTVQEVLVQVNIGEEPQKSGVAPDALPGFLEVLLESGLVRSDAEPDAEPGAKGEESGESGLNVRGLMCLPPHCGEAEAARPYFVRLRELRDGMRRRFGLPLPDLSMGMSGDYVQAIEEGATIIRVGTEIFGSRPARLA